MTKLDHTHDPAAESWIQSANQPGTDFPIQNLPFCVFRRGQDRPAIGIGIGDQILNLRVCAEKGLISAHFASAVSQPRLNELMSKPVADRVNLRHQIFDLLKSASKAQQDLTDAIVYQTDVRFLVPSNIKDYTDFYASIHHATNVGTMFRPTNPLLPNYKHIPIGYHGRASSVVVSGTDLHRPVGQKTPAEDGGMPTRSPAALLDYEMEVGFFVAQGNELGSTIPLENAEDHLFGMCLVNDWSARDIQKWEYVPLGPFLAKSFGTTISPWVVTMQALAPFRCPAFKRPEGDPAPLDYLSHEDNEANGGVDIQLCVSLASAKMREQGIPALKLTQASFTQMYWTVAQMLTHHSSNGCNLQPGDMMASGTVSGATRDSRGSMLELTWDGDPDNPVPGTQRTPLPLPTGEERKFVGDGDQIIMEGFCENETHRRIGFGQCIGTILPAHESQGG